MTDEGCYLLQNPCDIHIVQPCHSLQSGKCNSTVTVYRVSQGVGGGGVVVYQYTRKKFAKISKNTQNSSKYTQNYTQVYFIPEIQRK